MDKRQEILAAALKLFVEFGFHGTPTSKIAKEAGVANGTLFHYYATKDELVAALYIDIKQKMGQSLLAKVEQGEELEKTFRSLIVESFHWALENKLEFRFIQQFHTSPFISLIPPEVISQQMQYYVALVEAGIKAKILRPLPVDLICMLVTSHIFGVFHYLTTHDFSAKEIERTIHETFSMLWDMIT